MVALQENWPEVGRSCRQIGIARSSHQRSSEAAFFASGPGELQFYERPFAPGHILADFLEGNLSEFLGGSILCADCRTIRLSGWAR